MNHYPEKPPVAVDFDVGMATEGERVPGMPKEYSGWDVYNNEAKKVDTELVNDWRDSLNSLLLFAAIFAAVLTAFIIESKKMLEPDQGEMMVNVMIFLTNNLANRNHTLFSQPQFQPSSSSITINCLFFSSLSASLVAALASVVALQWVADYDAAITRGGSSPEDRAKRRQFRYTGVVRWKMSEIIAALPLLLYCSVVVFLAGLTIWMWSLHYIVGFVVAGGTGLAVLFYGLSTFLSIAFVSAPFRTPLSRWIYIAGHFWFSVIYRLARALHIPSVAAWFERGHLAYTVSRKREDGEVDKLNELAMDALVWLAKHLSISQDSYDRLLLLVGELPKLSWGEPSFLHLGDAPWFLIFDLLGWRNLKTDEEHNIRKRDIHSFGILAQLYRMPHVQEIISPIAPLFYISDELEEEYWLQCCEKTTTHWSPKPHKNTPNSLFLLLRDVPLPSNHTVGEIELSILLSRWRNSAHKPPENTRSRRRRVSASALSDTSAVPIPSQFLTQNELASWFSRSNEHIFTIIVQRIIETIVLSGGEIQPNFLNRLRLYFESGLLGSGPNLDREACLLTPLRYRDALLTLPWRTLGPHYAFTLLLARNLKHYIGEEKARRVKEVITMLWASPVNRDRPGGDNLIETFGMENFFDANKTEMMTWVKNANEIDHIKEILEELDVAQSSQRDIGPLWRATAPEVDTDPHFIEAMKAFRYLMSSSSPAIHRTLIQLLCRDIELGPLETFTSHLTISRLRNAVVRSDPCLMFLAQYVEGMGRRSWNGPLVEIKDPWKDSWARIATHLMKRHEGTDSQFILPLQACLWPALPDNGAAVCGRALREPRVLSHLQRIFEYSIKCHDHYDTEGHLLFHVLAHMENLDFPINYPEFKAVPLKGRCLDAIATLLVLSDEPGDTPSLNLSRPVDEKCLELMLGIFKRVATSQFALLAFLYSICTRMLEGIGIASEELAIVSICVTKALQLPRDERSVPILRPVIRQILRVRNDMVPHINPIAEFENVSVVCMRCTDRLNTYLATTLIFGTQNCRILSCARRPQSFSPAVGWLAEYVD